jgi:NADH-quinone oxidoreductase subunit L
MFHLTNHAFYKALLFLAAGGVIHALGGEEDLRKMGGLRSRLPVVYATFLVGALALAGFPLLSGFYSKDEIVYDAFTSARGSFLWGGVALIAAGFTAFYIFRAFFLAFHGKPWPSNGAASRLHPLGREMTAPLVLLAGLAVVAGYVQFPGRALEGFLDPVFTRYGAPRLVQTDFGGTYWAIAAASALVALLGIGLAWVMYAGESPLPHRLTYQLGGLHRLLLNDYYVERLYDATIVRFVRWLADWLAGVFDRGVVDGAVSGVAALVRRLSLGFGALETGYVRNYVLAFLLGAVLVLAYLIRSGVTP